MAIIYGPVYYTQSMYAPCLWVTKITSVNPIVKASLTAIVDGTSTTIDKSPFKVMANDYFFEFDFSRILQTQSQPKPQAQTSIFGSNFGQPYLTANPDIQGDFLGLVKYFVIDPVTGLLVLAPGTDILTKEYALSGAPQPFNENQGFNNYCITYAGNQPALVTHPFGLNYYKPICDTENEYMTFLPKDANLNAFNIMTFDSNNNLVETAVKKFTGNNTFTPYTIGVGVPNLTGVTWDSGAITSFSGVKYYTVTMGNLSMSGYIASSQLYVFEIKECCTKNLRLLWMNRLGGSEAFTFKVTNIFKEVAKSETGQIPARWDASFSLGPYLAPIRSFDKGRFKINSVAEKVFEVESEYYLPEVGYWLMELLSSPEVYMEWHDPMKQYFNFNIESGFVAVIVDDAELIWSQTNELVNVRVTFRMSNYVNLQQN